MVDVKVFIVLIVFCGMVLRIIIVGWDGRSSIGLGIGFWILKFLEF